MIPQQSPELWTYMRNEVRGSLYIPSCSEAGERVNGMGQGSSLAFVPDLSQQLVDWRRRGKSALRLGSLTGKPSQVLA